MGSDNFNTRMSLVLLKAVLSGIPSIDGYFENRITRICSTLGLTISHGSNAYNSLFLSDFVVDFVFLLSQLLVVPDPGASVYRI